jgi:hypothetical protein
MGHLYVREGLPDDALEAASEFYRTDIPTIEMVLTDPDRPEDELFIVFRPASYDHRGWRLAAIQDLAREAAPRRVNGVAGDDERAVTAAIDWLAHAPGITGQLLAVD